MDKDDIKLPPLHYDELPETDDLIPAMHNYARKAIKADRQRMGEPVAWAYELARSLTPDGEYGDWEARISFTKPNLPDKSIRNLAALYDSPSQHAEPLKTLNDDNSLTIAYMCGHRDGKCVTTPEGWQLVPKLPDWDMEMAGIKKLIQCTDGELECIDVDSLAVYINEVNEIFCAMLKAAPKFGEEQ